MNPKIEIINYFDYLMSRVDNDIRKSIDKYKDDPFLGELECYQIKKRKFIKKSDFFDFEYFDSNQSLQENKCNEWSQSTKVIDYLYQVRHRTIDELRKAQQESLEYLKCESCDLDRLFADKFYFQVFFKPHEKDISWIFNLYTFVTDFFLTPSEIKILENLINCQEIKTLHLGIFDEKFFLILKMSSFFWENLKYQQYPSHVINFRKHDFLNIKANFRRYGQFMRDVEKNSSLNSDDQEIEGSKLYHAVNYYLNQVNLNGLTSLKSLKLSFPSLEGRSFGKPNPLKDLTLKIESELNKESSIKLFEMFPNIEELYLEGRFSSLSFDSFVNLKKLSICGSILNNFNFDLFKNICNQLEYLRIELDNIKDKDISVLLNGHFFPNVKTLGIYSSKITRLEEKLFVGFPNLQSLFVNMNHALKTIDNEAFSNLKKLKLLGISFNSKLTKLDSELFRRLVNLRNLYVGYNNLDEFDTIKVAKYNPNLYELHFGHLD